MIPPSAVTVMKMLLPAINARDQDNPLERASAAAACSIQSQAIAASTMANTTTVALTAASRMCGTLGAKYLKKAQAVRQSRNARIRNVTGTGHFPATIEMTLH